MLLVHTLVHGNSVNQENSKKAFFFKKEAAVYLIGQRGRDADFRKDGTLSIWTHVGRKHITYTIPEHYKTIFNSAKEYDSMTVIERDGQLIGKLCCTIEVPETTGIHPVGIDLNQTNTLVATDADNKTLFVSGRTIKQKNRQNRKTRSRLQNKLAQHKADKCSTRSVRRTLKRLGKRISNRNRTFSQQLAKTVCEWAKPNSIFVFEDLTGIKKKKKYTDRKGNIRKSNEWNHRQIRMAIEHKAKFYGHDVTNVNPAYTSQMCSKCGILGTRRKHAFSCICGHLDHADINASKNIRNHYTILRSSGVQSITPEALIRNDVGQATTL